MKEWDDHQAVFTFLYDSIELTVALESPGGKLQKINKQNSVWCTQ